MIQANPAVSTQHDPRCLQTEVLASALADAVALRTYAAQARWNVRGEGLAAWRESFAVLEASAASWAELLASRTGQLGRAVKSTVRQAAGATRLDDYPCGLRPGAEHAAYLIAVLDHADRTLMGGHDTVKAHGDDLTAVLCMKLRAELASQRWLLEAALPLPLAAPPLPDAAAANREPHDEVEEASMESFPASDPPATRHHTD